MFIENKPKEQPPVGTHTARLFSIIDMGTQKLDFNGDIKFLRQVNLGWELCDEKMSDGRPFMVALDTTLSFSKNSNVTKIIKSWKNEDTAKGYDISKLLGEACNLSVSHNNSGWAKVTGVSPLKKNEVAPPLVNPIRDFWLAAFDQKTFDSIPDFLKDKIKQSPEYMEAIGAGRIPPAHVTDGQPIYDDLNDEIPFG
jgi:hypothetical protein